MWIFRHHLVLSMFTVLLLVLKVIILVTLELCILSVVQYCELSWSRDNWRDASFKSHCHYQLLNVQWFWHLIRLHSFWSHPSFSACCSAAVSETGETYSWIVMFLLWWKWWEVWWHCPISKQSRDSIFTALVLGLLSWFCSWHLLSWSQPRCVSLTDTV